MNQKYQILNRLKRVNCTNCMHNVVYMRIHISHVSKSGLSRLPLILFSSSPDSFDTTDSHAPHPYTNILSGDYAHLNS